MEEKMFYMPPLCKTCNKLNPNHVLILKDNYAISYDKFNKLDSKISTFIKNESGGINRYPIKLYVKNGYYR
ncbi:putative thioredoxin [Alphaentomopoxvirus acuprea]|uniref:Putative thioredoxin n=1 Tax=Alphaentomopoxvirus acuprea TaxID=62099 RepID=W6JIY2_9POXV|nr:putative thioredoxin [Anomala cuprea entomopoxvirus]BAO49527.1 putative thioredoxin [Anomala cuprea entomopoxvirus]